MRLPLLAALLATAATLAACDNADTYVVRSKVNGAWQIDARARVADGLATFECRHSASGTCHISLFANDALDAVRPVLDCATPGDARCTAKLLKRFDLAVDTRTALRGLAAFRMCASPDPAPLRPDCTPQPKAPA